MKTRAGFLILTTSVVACNSVLGIEDPIVTSVANGGAGGSGGADAGVGGSSSGGTAGSGGAAGAAGNGGSGTGATSSGGVGPGGTGAGGTADAGGASPGGAPTDGGTPDAAPSSCGDAGASALRCSATGIPEHCVGGTWTAQAPCSAVTVCAEGTCIPRPHCAGVANDCGTTAESCCISYDVPAGTFHRSNGAVADSATVSAFKLDKYEVTVGRFRKFVEGYPANRPAKGDGANPKISGSGWDDAWNDQLPVDRAELLSIIEYDLDQGTWTHDPTAFDDRPMNYLDWYISFAFCAWDGGRLPTEAEWNYAAAGGSEQRLYPWGQTAPAADSTQAIYFCHYGAPTTPPCDHTYIAPVGTASAGAGKWGHLDMAGSVAEWALDFYQSTYPQPCTDCAQTTGTWRVSRGGYWDSSATYITTIDRDYDSAGIEYAARGVRCAR